MLRIGTAAPRGAEGGAMAAIARAERDPISNARSSMSATDATTLPTTNNAINRWALARSIAMGDRFCVNNIS